MARASWRNWIPFIPGILKSVTIRLMGFFLSISRASLPLEAANTFAFMVTSRRFFTAERMSGSSSTTKIDGVPATPSLDAACKTIRTTMMPDLFP